MIICGINSLRVRAFAIIQDLEGSRARSPVHVLQTVRNLNWATIACPKAANMSGEPSEYALQGQFWLILNQLLRKTPMIQYLRYENCPFYVILFSPPPRRVAEKSRPCITLLLGLLLVFLLVCLAIVVSVNTLGLQSSAAWLLHASPLLPEHM